ncbi:hypothetical protein SGPA1_40089 [Streptomyces misionensis JCM 4497]
MAHTRAGHREPRTAAAAAPARPGPRRHERQGGTPPRVAGPPHRGHHRRDRREPPRPRHRDMTGPSSDTPQAGERDRQAAVA